MILREHLPYFAEIFALKGFVTDPVLTFGYHELERRPPPGWPRKLGRLSRILCTLAAKKRTLASVRFRGGEAVPTAFAASDLHGILRNYGSRRISVLDLFDARAELRQDMNTPLNPKWKQAFRTVIDIGSIEHVFDTRQCLANLFDLVAVGGHVMLHTPCNGFFDHGFHTFSPECLLQALELNGFEIRHVKYSSTGGVEVLEPDAAFSTLIWIVAQRKLCRDEFVVPQQGRWKTAYRAGGSKLAAG